MKKIFFIFFILFTVLNHAQKDSFSLEFHQDFTKENNNKYESKKYGIDIKTNYQFLTISAYCLNKSVESQFYFRTDTDNIWSEWIELKEDIESIIPDRKTYQYIHINNKIESIQFKSSLPISDIVNFRLFVSVEDSTANKMNVFRESTEVLDCDLPDYCDRACWCPSGDCTQGSLSSTEPTHIIVHHSGTNYTSGTNYALVVQSYWDYHVNTNGWSDIGYNWLVDPNGVLYEGRGSGIQGAHFSCMNAHTMGVCVIGNYETVNPTNNAISKLEALIAWEATDKNIDVLASSYHAPSQLTLYNISGHRDANSSPVGCPSGTVCPGENLYSLLPVIRSDVSEFPCYDVVSVDDLDFINNLKVYPNPTCDILNIEYKGELSIKEISIYSSLGLKIKTIKTTASTINLKNFSSGLYFIRISDNMNRIATLKFIKE
jgi:hypothetical protein